MNVKKNPKNNVICTMSYEKKKKLSSIFEFSKVKREYGSLHCLPQETKWSM